MSISIFKCVNEMFNLRGLKNYGFILKTMISVELNSVAIYTGQWIHCVMYILDWHCEMYIHVYFTNSMFYL